MKERSPYITEDWYDPITHEYFCAECHDVLERRSEVIKDHVMGVWRHYGYMSYNGIKATDNQGRTVENVWLRPPRTVKVLLPIQTNIRFCKDCFPLTPQAAITSCQSCKKEVEDNHEYTVCDLLWKHTNGYNGPFIQCALHIDCLPDHFDILKNFLESKNGGSGPLQST